MKIQVHKEFTEPKRGGPRRPGSYYITNERAVVTTEGCDRLPFVLQSICPTCGFILKPSKQPKLLNMTHLLRGIHNPCAEKERASCPLCWPTDAKAMLVWINAKRTTSGLFLEELDNLKGRVSWGLARPPRFYRPGRTWILLGSSRDAEGRRAHNIFAYFLGGQLERVQWRSRLTPADALLAHTRGAKLFLVEDDDPDYARYRKQEPEEEFA